jgi:hypothetical protein
MDYEVELLTGLSETFNILISVSNVLLIAAGNFKNDDPKIFKHFCTILQKKKYKAGLMLEFSNEDLIKSMKKIRLTQKV